MNTMPDASTPAPDYATIKQRQQATWASGDYASIGTRLQIVGETLAEAADVRAGEHVLDVAAGNGNASLAAARRHAHVVSTDYVQALLDRGRARAEADGLDVKFLLADAEALPFEDGRFDLVMSTFGVMFAPDHARAAREMLRVLRPGGRIAMANWTPAGFIGRVFKVVGAHVPPPPGVAAPALWGTEPHVVALFGPQAEAIHCEHRHFHFRYRSAAHWIEVFRSAFGPLLKAYGALGADRQLTLTRDLTALLEEFNTAGGGSLVVPGEYLEVLITRR